jgi:hypothetical protein
MGTRAVTHALVFLINCEYIEGHASLIDQDLCGCCFDESRRGPRLSAKGRAKAYEASERKRTD